MFSWTKPPFNCAALEPLLKKRSRRSFGELFVLAIVDHSLCFFRFIAFTMALNVDNFNTMHRRGFQAHFDVLDITKLPFLFRLVDGDGGGVVTVQHTDETCRQIATDSALEHRALVVATREACPGLTDFMLRVDDRIHKPLIHEDGGFSLVDTTQRRITDTRTAHELAVVHAVFPDTILTIGIEVEPGHRVDIEQVVFGIRLAAGLFLRQVRELAEAAMDVGIPVGERDDTVHRRISRLTRLCVDRRTAAFRTVQKAFLLQEGVVAKDFTVRFIVTLHVLGDAEIDTVTIEVATTIVNIANQFLSGQGDRHVVATVEEVDHVQLRRYGPPNIRDVRDRIAELVNDGTVSGHLLAEKLVEAVLNKLVKVMHRLRAFTHFDLRTIVTTRHVDMVVHIQRDDVVFVVIGIAVVDFRRTIANTSRINTSQGVDLVAALEALQKLFVFIGRVTAGTRRIVQESFDLRTGVVLETSSTLTMIRLRASS